MKTAKLKRKCPSCGRPIHAGLICCHECWLAIPLNIRMRFQAADKPERREIVRSLYETWGWPENLQKQKAK